MSKTNSEFRSDLAKEMRNKYKERDELIQQVDKLFISEELKEKKKKEIMNNFEKQIDEFKNRSWYEEARQSHLAEVKLKVGTLKLTKNIREIIYDIRKNYVKVEKGVKWKTISIRLPYIYNAYPWFTFECFIPDEQVNIVDFNKKVNKEKLYTYNEIQELWRKIRDYMKVVYVNKYGFEEYRRNGNFRGNVHEVSIVWPFDNWIYWIKDTSYPVLWENIQALWVPGQYPDMIYAWKNLIYRGWDWKKKEFNLWQAIYKLR